MAGNTRKTSYNASKQHPDDSILLAYLRKQQLEDHLGISQHIEVDKCPSCMHKLNALQQVSGTLEVLGEMRSHQHYPELSVAVTYAHIQRATSHRTPTRASVNDVNHQKRPGKSAVRLMSLPAAFGLAILFTMAMLVFANFTGKSLIPATFGGVTSHGQNILTVVVPPHSTLAPGPDLTTTGNTTANGLAVEEKTPQIKVCSTLTNVAQWRLVICGSHFDSIHKVTFIIYVPGNKPIWMRNLPVDKHGKLRIGWQIANCANLPSFIYGKEATSSKSIHVKLQITSFGNCSITAATPIAEP